MIRALARFLQRRRHRLISGHVRLFQSLHYFRVVLEEEPPPPPPPPNRPPRNDRCGVRESAMYSSFTPAGPTCKQLVVGFRESSKGE